MGLFNNIEILIWAILGLPLGPIIGDRPLPLIHIEQPAGNYGNINCYLTQYAPGIIGPPAGRRPTRRVVVIRMPADDYDLVFSPGCKKAYLTGLFANGSSFLFEARRKEE